MDEALITKGMEDITTEIQGLSTSLNQHYQAMFEKTMFDSGLGEAIANAITGSVKNLLEKKNYDEGLGESIKTAIAEAAEKIASIKVDVSPVMKIGLDMVSQVRGMIDAFVNMPRPETNDERYNKLVELTLGVIAKNNELFSRFIEKQSAPVVAMGERKDIIESITHIRNDGRIISSVLNYKKNEITH